MSSPSPLQCLFCNHLNPGGATFCNDCGSQLQLQQCDLCGSINKRSARTCYKCGAPFGAIPAHGAHPVIDSGPEGSVFRPEQSDQTTLPESAAQAYAARCRESPDAGVAVPAAGDRGKVAARTRQEPVQDAARPVDLALSPEAAASTGFRHLYSIAGLVLVLALVVLSIYYYRAPSAADVAEAGIEPTAPDDSPSAGATPDALSVVPADSGPGSGSIRPPLFRALGFSEEASPPSGVAARMRPAVADNAAAVRPTPARKSCQEALVALGLCGALAKPEEP